MLGDTAVAVHPQDDRYKHLIGERIMLPLSDRSIPIIADPFVEKSFGSGAVKITPAHDFNDFETGLRHHLPMINILTPDGHINELGGKFSQLTIEEARSKIVEELTTLNLIEKIEPYTLRVGLSYRSKAIIQPYLSKQWFVKITHFKKNLISAVRDKRVKLIPAHWEQTYFHWIENLRDWCVSRQIWWGHRIPIWHHLTTGEMLCSDEEDTPLEVKQDPTQWVQEKDVLDTWFSSSLWPFSSLGWPDKTDEFKKFYPTSTLITGHDILFFWVARMILMGEYTQETPPFNEVFLHGLIYGKSYWRTQEGMISYLSQEEKKKYDLGAPVPPDVQSKWEKMSKSKGNVIDPLEVIEQYGTDALRITLASGVTQARQIDLDLRKFEEFKNFANKLWNGSRFVLLNLETLTSDMLSEGLKLDLISLEDQWILSVLARTTKEIHEGFSEYAFDKAAMRAYEFFWNDVCSIYLEVSKPILFGKTGNADLKVNKQKLLLILLLNSIRLLHPITPFITEEIFSILKNLFPNLQTPSNSDPYTLDAITALLAPACLVSSYPQVIEKDINLPVEENFSYLNEVVRTIRNIRTEMQIPPSEKTDLYIIGNPETRNYLLAKKHQNILLALTATHNILFTEQEPPIFGSSGLIGELKLLIPIPDSFRLKEKARLEKEKEKGEKLYKNTEERLANKEFLERAPEEIVKKLTDTLLSTKKQLEEIAAKLYDL
jgi:valyl-tRNA synthetase